MQKEMEGLLDRLEKTMDGITRGVPHPWVYVERDHYIRIPLEGGHTIAKIKLSHRGFSFTEFIIEKDEMELFNSRCLVTTYFLYDSFCDKDRPSYSIMQRFKPKVDWLIDTAVEGILAKGNVGV